MFNVVCLNNSRIVVNRSQIAFYLKPKIFADCLKELLALPMVIEAEIKVM